MSAEDEWLWRGLREHSEASIGIVGIAEMLAAAGLRRWATTGRSH